MSWTRSPQARLLQILGKHWMWGALSVAPPAPQSADIASWFCAPPDPVAYVWVSVAVWTRTCPFGIAVSSCQADRVQNVKLPGNICRALPGALAHRHQEGKNKHRSPRASYPRAATTYNRLKRCYQTSCELESSCKSMLKEESECKNKATSGLMTTCGM